MRNLRNEARIFTISLLGLFLELMLIRWIGTEIRIFAYLQNTVLIVCFLGLGVGCFTCSRPATLRHILIPLAILVGILALPPTRHLVARITELLSVLSDLLIWERAVNQGPLLTLFRVTLGLGLTLALMALLWEVFVPIGRILGRTLSKHPRVLRAYSINVAGSLAGIWLFVALSSLWLPPVVWVAVAVAIGGFFLAPLPQRRAELALIAATVGLAAIGFLSNDSESQLVWSPYQKLELTRRLPEGIWGGESLINVNNAGYQGMINLQPDNAAKNPKIPADLVGYSQYDVPLLLHPDPQEVLIVGAGSGNDVAGALRGGAKRVTAVEIDPAIIEFGQEHHPEKPYDSERVEVVNDDARSYFATTERRFDLIIFGLLDSHTTTAMTNARLDHYVYTRESITRAKSLLKDGGVVALSFEALKPFISDRMGTCLTKVFGQAPLTFRIPHNPTGWGGAMFVTGDMQAVQSQLAKQPELQSHIDRWRSENPITLTGATRVATDDWPYIYLETPKIPLLYYLLGGLMIGLLAYAKRRVGEDMILGPWGRSEWHFALLGAAFMLLEVQNISKASVVLGNTWQVNAIVITGILSMILLANWIAARFPNLRLLEVGAGLLLTCVALYFIDLSSFAFLPYTAKALIVGGLTTLPLLFSGIIFARTFQTAAHKHRALGANLIGSIAGGMLQSLTFVFGIRSLLLLVAVMYSAALWLAPHAAGADQSLSDEGSEDRCEQEQAGESQKLLEV